MFDKSIDVKLCHDAIDILPTHVLNFHEIGQVLVFENYKSNSEKTKALMKIHWQFSYASSDNVKRLLKQANLLDNNILPLIDKVYDTCKTCKQYKKPSHCSVVGLSKASDFNHTVAMDLHQLGSSLWYFHVIDEFTHFSNAVIVHTKSSKIIAEKFLHMWISIFGPPKQTFSDNEGEFVSQYFVDLCENFNINIKSGPAKFPWSNGLCEHHNKILSNIILKIKEDISCSWENALA